MTELATPPVEQQQDVKRISHWIGGRIVEGESGRSGPVYNPALGRQTGAVDFASAEEMDKAVQAAKAAFPGWRATSLSKKSAILFRVRELVHERGVLGDPGEAHDQPGREVQRPLVEQRLEEQVRAGLERRSQADDGHVGVLRTVDG